MTRWSTAAATLLALTTVACAVYQKKQPVEGDKAIVNAYIRAWNQRDTIALDTLLAADAIHEDVAGNFRGKGPKAVITYMRGIATTEPDYKWTVTNALEDGKLVAVEWNWTGTYSGLDPNGKRVTNKRVSGRGVSIAEVDDGKIKRFTDYYDLASYFR
jgi:steroid delta-isomerase-like uncharacterized protein